MVFAHGGCNCGGNATAFITAQVLDQAAAMADETKAQDEANKVLEVTNKLLKDYSNTLTKISTIPGVSKSTRAVAESSTAITGKTSESNLGIFTAGNFTDEFAKIEPRN